MALSKEQVDALFLFTQKKMVHYYDLQTEIVDHLAERIEEEMLMQPSLNFENALQKVYKDFGIFGFSKIVQEKEQQAHRAGKKLFWNEFFHLFRWPQFISVALVFLVIWQFAQMFPLDILQAVFFVLWTFFTVIQLISTIKKNKQQKMKLLLIFYHPETFFPFLWMEYIVLFRLEINFYVFCTLTPFAIILKIASQKVYNNVRKQAMQQYPEAFA